MAGEVVFPRGHWFSVRHRMIQVGYGLAGILAFFFAYWLVTEGGPGDWRSAVNLSLLAFCARYLGGMTFGLVTSQWRFVSVRDTIRLSGATVVGSIILLAGSRLFSEYFPVPFAVVLVDGIIYIVVIAAFWVAYRANFERTRLRRSPRQPTQRVLVVGAGEAGNMLVREMVRFPTGYHPIGFLDDDPAKEGARIHGVRVLGKLQELAAVAHRERIDEVIIAIPSMAPHELRGLISACEKSGLRFKVLPGILQVLEGEVGLSQLRDVKIEDLLGRDPVELELPELSEDLRGRSVLITGAAGSIGSELARQVALHEPKVLVLLDQAETDLFFTELELRGEHPDLKIIPLIGDIVDAPTVERVFDEYRPERVFHAAAYKHVPMMESNPLEAIKNNVIGTWRIADAAGRYGAEKFVLVSTDKAVRPANVMGATKRLAELLTLELQEEYPEMMCGAVRFGNVLGSNGSVIPIFRKQLEEGKPLTVTHPEATRYFMTIPEAVQLILQTSLLPQFRGRIAMLDMGEPVRILDLAKNLLRLAGVNGKAEEMVTFTGLRPGEKLHEELVAPEERAVRTAVPKVSLLRSAHSETEKFLRIVVEWDDQLTGTNRGQARVVNELVRYFPSMSIDWPSTTVSVNH